MSTREKIIVLCAGLALMYGAYTFFYPMIAGTVNTPPKQESQEFIEFVEEVRRSLAQEGVSEPDEYIIQKAAVKWGHNPFLDSGLSVQTEPPEAQVEALLEKLEIIYSGYLVMGNRILAIINGMEYETGEEIIGCEGCIVTDISPVQIEIKLKKHKKKLIIPVKEEEQG